MHSFLQIETGKKRLIHCILYIIYIMTEYIATVMCDSQRDVDSQHLKSDKLSVPPETKALQETKTVCEQDHTSRRYL